MAAGEGTKKILCYGHVRVCKGRGWKVSFGLPSGANQGREQAASVIWGYVTSQKKPPVSSTRVRRAGESRVSVIHYLRTWEKG